MRLWPTLEGRLNNSLTSRKEGLLQMYNRGDNLSEAALEEIEKIIENDKELDVVREKIKKTIDTSPESVSFENAKKQVENSRK